jgi:hypothetical protein
VFKLSPDTIFAIVISVLLGIVGYFLKETCVAIKGLERDIITIREKMLVLEATRITRADIKEMISEYHTTHPCKGAIK